MPEHLKKAEGSLFDAAAHLRNEITELMNNASPADEAGRIIGLLRELEEKQKQVTDTIKRREMPKEKK